MTIRVITQADLPFILNRRAVPVATVLQAKITTAPASAKAVRTAASWSVGSGI